MKEIHLLWKQVMNTVHHNYCCYHRSIKFTNHSEKMLEGSKGGENSFSCCRPPFQTEFTNTDLEGGI